MTFFRPMTAGGGRLLALGALAALMITTAATAETRLRAVMHTGLRGLDPVLSTAHITRNHAYMIYDVIAALDESQVPQPQMATWDISDDGKTYTFTLRDGLVFHDGNPVLAVDAVASIRRWGKRDAGGQFIFGITDSLEAVSDTVFVWTLNEPFPQLVPTLAKPSVPPFVMPARVAETPADTAITDHIGSGPFVFDMQEFQPGVSALYRKFDDYVPREEPADGMAGGKLVNVDAVEWLAIPDMQTAVNALASGEIDMIERVQIDLLPLLEYAEDVTLEQVDPFGQQNIGRVNFLHPPFDNLLIRQAALRAIDQAEMVATIVGNPNHYRLCGSVFGCGTLLSDETGGEWLKDGADIEGAKALLAEAGYDGTPVVILQAADLPELTPMAVVAADGLRKAGFNVDVQAMDWQTLTGRRANKSTPAEGGWNMFFTNTTITEIDTPLKNFFVASKGDDSWFGWPTDPEMETYREQFIRAETLDQQREAARAVQKRAIENVTYIPLGEMFPVQGRSNMVTDVLKGAVPVFWELKKTD